MGDYDAAPIPMTYPGMFGLFNHLSCGVAGVEAVERWTSRRNYVFGVEGGIYSQQLAEESTKDGCAVGAEEEGLLGVNATAATESEGLWENMTFEDCH
jgi:hypothetical protein